MKQEIIYLKSSLLTPVSVFQTFKEIKNSETAVIWERFKYKIFFA